jgi:hypothetical protein
VLFDYAFKFGPGRYFSVCLKSSIKFGADEARMESVTIRRTDTFQWFHQRDSRRFRIHDLTIPIHVYDVNQNNVTAGAAQVCCVHHNIIIFIT